MHSDAGRSVDGEDAQAKVGAGGGLRALGGTEVRVSPLGLGCWQFSQGRNAVGRFWPDIDQGTVERIVEASLEEGMNWFDTAELYGAGASEEALSKALRAAGRSPGEVVIATKWSPLLRRAGHIKRSAAERARHLAPFPIDLHQIHQHIPLSSVRRQMDAMADLLEAGTIRGIGVSNFGERHMREAHAALARRGIPLASNQVRYNLLDRRIERNGVLDAARELGITIIAYSPLAQGHLSGKFHDDAALLQRMGAARRRMRGLGPKSLERSAPIISELGEIAGRHGRTRAQVALNWLAHSRPGSVVAIPGARDVEQARENARASSFRLTGEEVARLDEVSA
jgi:aryl-alcohol dehydrogenase-like predicted oxidoreductase